MRAKIRVKRRSLERLLTSCHELRRRCLVQESTERELCAYKKWEGRLRKTVGGGIAGVVVGEAGREGRKDCIGHMDLG